MQMHVPVSMSSIACCVHGSNMSQAAQQMINGCIVPQSVPWGLYASTVGVKLPAISQPGPDEAEDAGRGCSSGAQHIFGILQQSAGRVHRQGLLPTGPQLLRCFQAPGNAFL